MGCFSWVLLDTRKEMIAGNPFKLLIPEKFGGGSIVSIYDDYGNFDYKELTFDLFEIIGFWNFPELMKGEVEMFGFSSIDVVQTKFDPDSNNYNNRNIGIDNSAYDRDAAKLKYPLRLVSADNQSNYEDYDGKLSIAAPDQGWAVTTIYDPLRFEVSSYVGYNRPEVWNDTTIEVDDEEMLMMLSGK